MVKANFKIHRYAGISLSGAKRADTCLAVIDEYVDQEKTFLAKLHLKIGEDTKLSSDSKLIKILDGYGDSIKRIAVDAPLKLPKCMRCRLTCPGIEKCEEEEILWMKAWHKKRAKVKRPNKWFSGYSERCSEQFIASELEKEFHPDQAFGANRAPFYARMQFIKKRVNIPMVEVNPRVNVWRLGKALGIRETQLKAHKNPTRGITAREAFMSAISSEGLFFIYNQDLRAMTEDAYAFEAFLSAITAMLYQKRLCEPKPVNFPKSEAWVSFPKTDWLERI